MEFVARYRRTIWQSGDDSVVIASVVDEGNEQRTVKGPSSADRELQEGLWYRFQGQWERHKRHGRQFVFAFYSAVIPHDRRGVIAYLVSIAEGIGEKRAARLWEAFGSEAVTVLRTQPEKTVAAGILSHETAQEAARSLHEESAFESVKIDLLALFAGRGFQIDKLLKACLQAWGSRAPERIRKNPYLLMFRKLPSAGWKRCDRLYLDLGLPPQRLKRQALCVWQVIVRDSSGHTWHDAQQIARALRETISDCDTKKALRLAIRGRLLAKYKNGQRVWLAESKKAFNEAMIADKVREIIRESAIGETKEAKEKIESGYYDDGNDEKETTLA